VRGALLVTVTSACSFTPGTLASSGSGDGSVDGDFTTGWSTPVELVELHDAAGADDPSLTDDLLQIYFGSSRPGGMGFEDIWFAKRASIGEPFGEPMPVVELNSSSTETTMRITGNGKAIYFASNRGGTGQDIYFSTRSDLDQPWTTPSRLPELSTSNGDWAPFAQSDQLRVILCSGATELQEALFIATRASTSAPWGPPTRIAELDGVNESECDPVEPRSGVVYYSSNHLNADLRFDIYRASRTSSTSPFGDRTAVSSVNLPGINDRDAWVSADERTMVFASDRDLVNMQIYITTR
jgi:hypothetical protein